MKIHKFFGLFLIISLSTISAFGGVGSSGGGGTSVVFPNGEVKFLDFLHKSEMPQVPTKSKIDYLWLANRYITKIASEKKDFFKNALSILDKNASRFPVFHSLQLSLQNLYPISLEIRLTNPDYMSPSAPMDTQELLAVYQDHKLYLSGRPISLMSNEDIDGLALHESLRHLNFMQLLKEPLATEEIEILVRYFSDKSFSEDDYQPILQKLNDLKNSSSLTEALSRINAARNAKHWVGSKRSDKTLSAREKSELEREHIRLDDLVDKLENEHIRQQVESLQRATMGLQQVIDITILTIELKVCQRYDVYLKEVIDKCF